MEYAKGAEAEIKREDDKVIKDRVKKGYRLEQLDKTLRQRRTKQESKLLREARRAGVATPQVLEEGKTTIEMEFIDGEKVRDVFDKAVVEIATLIGKNIGILHQYDIIHGDLTTSNMILKDGRIYFIDFGLGFVSKRLEDKANDLYLLEEVLESTHFSVFKEAWKAILEAYKAQYPDGEKAIKVLLEVEKRGRYKER